DKSTNRAGSINIFECIATIDLSADLRFRKFAYFQGAGKSKTAQICDKIAFEIVLPARLAVEAKFWCCHRLPSG
ncbi:MAG TPA: hypothetical protein VHZ30_02695, partial [Verrucomicrobiae bacterium]|nr:hypothetical protein [Verrucomicrobiae bacterium]